MTYTFGELRYHPIPLAQARAWLSRHFGRVGIPAGASCWFVEGVQYNHVLPGLYLLSEDCGCCGVFILVKKEQAA